MISSHRSLFAQLVVCAAFAALIGVSGCATAPAVSPALDLPFPSPISGPGRPDLDRGAQRAIDEGWNSLLRGDNAGARSSAARVENNPAATLLELQSVVVADNRDTIAGLVELTATLPGYAAAWLTLSAAAEKADNEALALSAADRGAKLWSNERWVDRARSLHTRWVDDRIKEAERLCESDQPTEALAALEPALALEPGNKDAVLVKTSALIASGSPTAPRPPLPFCRRIATSSCLPEASRRPAVIRAPRFESIRRWRTTRRPPCTRCPSPSPSANWQTAMRLYSALPNDHPEKAEGLGRAKLRWRVSVMPTYVQDAMLSMELERAQLAVILVTLAPRVERLAGGQVPLLSDIVDMPSQQEIVTATRLGLIPVDRFDHRFNPLRLATVEETRTAVSTLGELLALDPPQWCSEEIEDSCILLETPISGEAVAVIVIDMVVRESS